MRLRKKKKEHLGPSLPCIFGTNEAVCTLPDTSEQRFGSGASAVKKRQALKDWKQSRLQQVRVLIDELFSNHCFA